MKLLFQEWLLVENTVAQSLKAHNPQAINALIQYTDKFFIGYAHFAAQINAEKRATFVKWVIYHAISDFQITVDSPHNPELLDKIKELMRSFIQHSGDYIAFAMQNQWNEFRSKLNNPNYRSQLLTDSHRYHDNLEKKATNRVGPIGRPLHIEGMPNGYTWVSLDKEYCEHEGKAMGHCGNQGFHSGDNIYSLRDRKGNSCLTFVVNDGQLGESKGFGNNKPSPVYHQAIAALLVGYDDGLPIVEHIKGGGYRPENNFKFSDLPDYLQEKVLEKRPHIDDKVGFYSNKLKLNAEQTKEFITRQEWYDIPVNIEKEALIIHKDKDIKELMNWMHENTTAHMDVNPSVHIDKKDIVKCWETFATRENNKLLEDLLEEFGKNQEEEQGESWRTLDLKYALEVYNELYDELHRITEKEYEDALNDPQDSILEMTTISGFYVDYEHGEYVLKIPLSKFIKLGMVRRSLPIKMTFPPPIEEAPISEYAYNRDVENALDELRRNL